jgi:hypothetical protein
MPIFRVTMRHPGDASGVLRLIDDGLITAESIAAIFGKTEGNGCVNDFTRGYALSAVSGALAPRLGVAPEAVPPVSRWSCRAARKADCRRISWCLPSRPAAHRSRVARRWQSAPRQSDRYFLKKSAGCRNIGGHNLLRCTVDAANGKGARLRGPHGVPDPRKKPTVRRL